MKEYQLHGLRALAQSPKGTVPAFLQAPATQGAWRFHHALEDYGPTPLVRLNGLAEELGLVLLEERADGLQYRIAGDSMAGALLARMLERGWYPTKYEVMEPSLHEIFIEKVGEDA